MKPILFNTDMVCAIKNGTKTVTRRVIKEPWYIEDEDVSRMSGYATHRGYDYTHGMPYPDSIYHPSDILYVRETWAPWSGTDGIVPEIHYKADGEILPGVKWRPSIHMPHEAARIFLRVSDVRVERLQDITEEQSRAEGAEPFMITADVDKPDGEKRWEEILPALSMFPRLWDSTIKLADRALYGWAANPWVWVISFERISREEAEL